MAVKVPKTLLLWLGVSWCPAPSLPLLSFSLDLPPGFQGSRAPKLGAFAQPWTTGLFQWKVDFMPQMRYPGGYVAIKVSV